MNDNIGEHQVAHTTLNERGVIMNITTVSEGIFNLSVSLENILFEGIWEIPRGVSVNSYIVKGEKIALVDGVCGWDGVPEHLFEMLDQMNMTIEDVDYLIINHMEPDHSGWLEDLRSIKANLNIICTKPAEQLLEAFYGRVDNIRVVKDGDTLDLGNGRVLTFATVPNVHWPDAMVTYDTLTQTLFSCDVFGTYGHIEGKHFDDDLTEEELVIFEEEGVRYYSNIVATFSDFTKKALDKLKDIEIKVIAPGHGLVWRKNPGKIIDDYKRYVAYQKEPDLHEVTVLYGSMYGMTEKAALHVVENLKQYDVKVNVHRVPETSWGTVLASVWNSSGIILAMPTYEYKMFPPMAAVLEELGNKKVHNRKALRIGSYGWSGGAQKELDEIMKHKGMKWTFIDPVEFKGAADESDYQKMDEGVEKLMEMIGVSDTVVTV
jgi:flavorubredoxin